MSSRTVRCGAMAIAAAVALVAAPLSGADALAAQDGSPASASAAAPGSAARADRPVVAAADRSAGERHAIADARAAQQVPAVGGRPHGPRLAATGSPLQVRPAVADRTPETVLAATDPFTDDDAGGGRATSRPDPPSTARIDRVVRQLRRGPLAIDPELRWMLDDRTEERVRRMLADSDVPVLVAVLPSEDEDESGGDTRRVLQSLQRGVGKDAVYVTVDQRGRFDLASLGIDRSLEISYSLLLPPRDDRPYDQQEGDPRPPGWASVPDRLQTIVTTSNQAGPGTPNGVVDRVRPLEPVDRTNYRANRNREDAIAATSVGLVLGVVVALTFIGIRGAVRSARAEAASGTAGRGGGRSGGGNAARKGRAGPGGGRRRKRKGRRG